MKIVYVINSFALGGAERLLIDSLSVLKEKKYDVQVVALKPGYESFEKELYRIGIDCKIFNTKSFYDIRTIVGFFFYMRDILKDGPVILHSHLFPSVLYCFFIKIFFQKKVNFFFTEHDTTNNRRGRFFSFLDRVMYFPMKKVISISEGVENELLSVYPTLKYKSEVIYNGINMSLEKDKYDFEGDYIEIVTVGRLEDKKDQKKAISCISKNEKLRLTIIGDGTLLHSLKDFADDLGVKDRVFFKGAMPSVKSELKKFDAYIHCAKVEGFGLVIAEAMSAGLPVFCINVDGLKEVVSDHGFFFSDECDFLNILNEYMAYPIEKKITLAQEARKHVEKKFSINAHVDSLLKVYDFVNE